MTICIKPLHEQGTHLLQGSALVELPLGNFLGLADLVDKWLWRNQFVISLVVMLEDVVHHRRKDLCIDIGSECSWMARLQCVEGISTSIHLSSCGQLSAKEIAKISVFDLAFDLVGLASHVSMAISWIRSLIDFVGILLHYQRGITAVGRLHVLLELLIVLGDHLVVELLALLLAFLLVLSVFLVC